VAAGARLLCGIAEGARALDSGLFALRYLWRRLFTPAIHDWSEHAQPREGPRAAVATLVRRQRRLWRR